MYLPLSRWSNKGYQESSYKKHTALYDDLTLPQWVGGQLTNQHPSNSGPNTGQTRTTSGNNSPKRCYLAPMAVGQKCMGSRGGSFNMI